MTPDRRASRFSHSNASYANCPTDQLADRLEGVDRVNLAALGKRHFTPDYLHATFSGFYRSLEMMADLPFDVTFTPSELNKCVVHYCARELITDLWKIGAPTIKRFTDSKGRVILADVLASGNFGDLTVDIDSNLDVGNSFIRGLVIGIYNSWVDSMRAREQDDPEKDPLPLMHGIYKLFSVLQQKGDWEAQTTLESTFIYGARANFNWANDYPDFTREEIEEIIENSVVDNIAYASELGKVSTARQQALEVAEENNDPAFVLDPAARAIVLNPDYAELMAEYAVDIEDRFPDQTKLKLKCPALFVKSDVFPEGSMLHDLLRFKFKVYAEIYLETQRIKAAA